MSAAFVFWVVVRWCKKIFSLLVSWPSRTLIFFTTQRWGAARAGRVGDGGVLGWVLVFFALRLIVFIPLRKPAQSVVL